MSISEAAKVAGVAPSTLRRWEREGKIQAERTQGVSAATPWPCSSRTWRIGRPVEKKTVAYARVSSHDQKDDLERQKQMLEIITVFSARLYGSRSHKNRKLIEGMKEAVDAAGA
jgi:Predicted site-specific integrase-resolvase